MNKSRGVIKSTQKNYFLYDDNKIVGLFKIRHELNNHLKKEIGGVTNETNRNKKYRNR
jgi:predicted acetyltransferase